MVSEGLNAVSSVQCVADLLISLHEPLQFAVKLDILSSKNVAVVLKSVNFGSVVSVGL